MTYTANSLFYKEGKGEEYETITATGTVVAGQLVTYAGTAAADGAVVRGIAQHDAASGEKLTIVTRAQETALLAGGSFSVGAAIASNASGRGITAVTGKYVFARALEASTGNGKFALVEIRPEGLLTIA